MKEPSLYPEIRKALEGLGMAVTKVPGSPYNMGIPDFICTHRGRAVHIEVKLQRKGKASVPTLLQIDHLDRHRRAGAFAAVLYFHEPSKRWIGFPGNGAEYSAGRKQLQDLFDSMMRGGDTSV